MDKYYKTGDFARMIGITSVTLRKWEKQGKLEPHHKSPTGYRYYSEQQLHDYLSNKGGDANVRS